jgi:hypothetical protein
VDVPQNTPRELGRVPDVMFRTGTQGVFQPVSCSQSARLGVTAPLPHGYLRMATELGIHAWWQGRPEERFWLEVTNRSDIGTNLNAPQANEAGTPYWSYSLLQFVQSGDTLLHYDANIRAIVGSSIASGRVWEDTVVWGARGTSARNAGIAPHPRVGWYLALEGFERLLGGIMLEEIRAKEPELAKLVRDLQAEVGEPLYFPFEMGRRRPLRTMQGYLFKLPAFFLQQFSSLAHVSVRAAEQVPTPPVTRVEIGTDYRPADEDMSVAAADPFFIDPALVERALRGHAATQNALAALLLDRHLSPRSAKPNEPNFDLAWEAGGSIWVAEVKSLSDSNEEKQLRLGLGQLLRYKHLLDGGGSVRGVLVAERQPTDQSWDSLCARYGVLLVWPQVWSSRLDL